MHKAHSYSTMNNIKKTNSESKSGNAEVNHVYGILAHLKCIYDISK